MMNTTTISPCILSCKRMVVLSFLSILMVAFAVSPMTAAALPFNQDMVGTQLGLGDIQRPNSPGSISQGTSQRYVEGGKEGAANLTNPVQPSTHSISNGKRLFDAQCSPCHGKIVDTSYIPGAVSIYLPGPNLFQEVYRQKSDGHFFQFIKYGGMAIMPAYGTKFSVTEHWDIVNYVRSVQASGLGTK